jgi:hypothetical protein
LRRPASSVFLREIVADGGTRRSLNQENGMARKKERTTTDDANRIKDPEDWTTGDEPMTGAQESYLHTLASEAGEGVDDDLTKAEASRRIDELQEKTGRGRD